MIEVICKLIWSSCAGTTLLLGILVKKLIGHNPPKTNKNAFDVWNCYRSMSLATNARDATALVTKKQRYFYLRAKLGPHASLNWVVFNQYLIRTGHYWIYWIYCYVGWLHIRLQRAWLNSKSSHTQFNHGYTLLVWFVIIIIILWYKL